MKAAEFRRLIEEKGKLEAVRSVPSLRDCPSEAHAEAHIRVYVQRLLDERRYAVAALVLWGSRIFDPRPESVQQVWRAIEKHALFLAQGGGSLGKSYSIIAWILLDWWRDPEYTSVKLISTTAGHVKANTFATLAMLHREACIRMPGEVFAEHIGLEATDKRACISVVKIPQGDDGKGRLQGFHPIPRPKVHPTLGGMSRIRVFIDEAEETPIGVWDGVKNLTTTLSGTENLKINGAYNPKNQGSKVAQLAEPKKGWENFDIEKDISWDSKFNWHVERLDAKRCENVIQKREVYPGLQTYEGYRLMELEHGGHTPGFYTFGRGCYPPQGVAFNIIIPAYLNGCRGEFTFTGATMKFAGVDTATEGRDDAVLTAGRYGKAVSFQHESGHIIKFPEPRMAAQVDQQITLVKGSTSIVAHSIRDNCRLLQIPPDNVMLDRTGVGAVPHDLLKENEVWSPFVMGVDFNKAATEMKVLEQDQETADEMYDGVVTEVWFALAKWMEFIYLAISPGVARDRLNSELLARQYKLVGKKYRVRKKDEFKTDFGYSCDYADSLTIFLHAIRVKTQAQGSMTGKTTPPLSYENLQHGVVDVQKYVDMSGV